MPNKETTPLSLYGNDREYLREQEKTNELLAEIAGEEYESPGDIPNGKYVIQKRMLDAAQKKNELLESIAEGGGGGGAAKGINIDYGTDIISLKNKDGDVLDGSGATLPAYGVTFDSTTGGLTLTKNGAAMSGQTVTIPNYGSPVGVTDSSDMVDEGVIYLYEGETGGGYTNGHFYYYNGTAWADGGEYAAATVQTDKTLLVEDRAADAKATGEAVSELKTQYDNHLLQKVVGATITKGKAVKADTGVNTSAATWARTELWNGHPTRTGFNLPDANYTYRIHYYDSTGNINNGTGYLGYSGATKTGIQYIPKTFNGSPVEKVCVCFQRADLANMDATDAATLKAEFVSFSATDVTLTYAEIPADAKATGEKISEIYEETDKLDANIYSIVTGLVPPKSYSSQNWYKGSISDHGTITDETCPTVYSGRLQVQSGDMGKVVADPAIEYRVIYYNSFTTQYNTWVKNSAWTTGTTDLDNGYTIRVQARYLATPETDITDLTPFPSLVSITTYNAETIKDANVLTAPKIFNGEPVSGTYDFDTPLTAYGAMFKGKDNVEAFAFFTDPHVLGFGDADRNTTKKNNYCKRVQNVYNNSPCSFLVCGGDWLNNATTMDEACYRLGNLKGIADHLLSGCKLVNGNHDTNEQGKLDSGSANNTGTLDNATIAAIMYRDTDTKKAYYSFDGANSKCYVLDSGKDSSHSSMSEYDWEQVEWLAGKLSEDDPEHAIIFLHIIIISGNVQTFASTFGALVEGYNAHTTVTLNSVNYDFTGCSGHVDFWVAGHTHSDSTGTLGGIPYIITATNSYDSDVPLIDLVLVDYDNSVVNTVRVGGTGENRTISLV